MLPARLARFWRRRSPALFLVAIVAAFTWVHVRAGFEYSRIELGMDRTEVIALLGEPRRVGGELVFCMTSVQWSGECPDTGVAGTYLYYKYGVARWVIVGADARDIVTFKTLGDT